MGTMKSAVNPSNDDGDELEPLKIRAAYFFSKVSYTTSRFNVVNLFQM